MQGTTQAGSRVEQRASRDDRKRLPSDAFDQQKRAMAHPHFKVAGGRAQAVLLVLIVEWCDRDAECWPSINSIAAMLGCDEKGVRNAFNQLEQLGLISFPDGRKGGRIIRGGKTQARTNKVRVEAALASAGEIAHAATRAKTPASRQAKSPELTQAISPPEQNAGEQDAQEQHAPSTPPADAGGFEEAERERRVDGLMGAYCEHVGRDFMTPSERKNAERAFGEVVDAGCTEAMLFAAMDAWDAIGWGHMTPKGLAAHLGHLLGQARTYGLLGDDGRYTGDGVVWGGDMAVVGVVDDEDDEPF